jgi:hypothetical protein
MEMWKKMGNSGRLLTISRGSYSTFAGVVDGWMDGWMGGGRGR